MLHGSFPAARTVYEVDRHLEQKRHFSDRQALNQPFMPVIGGYFRVMATGAFKPFSLDGLNYTSSLIFCANVLEICNSLGMV
jgi:hypothetical protein